MAPPGFDIFCRVIDNFGDIGVCWRLAKQLAQRPEADPVRLWVDDLASFARIEQSVDAAAVASAGLSPAAPHQTVQGVQLQHWTHSSPPADPYRVVIEAFACDPPAGFLARMGGSLWINLEYLSAEDWVEDCHGLPSLQPNGLQKYFFFPGFTGKTGGLLREPELIATQAAWNALPEQRWRLLRDIGMPAAQIQKLQQGWRQAFIFCYGNADANALARALGQSGRPTVAIVPQGVMPQLAALQSDTLQVHESPFVDQEGFDRLLWSSDLNIVRGEDSLVRAIWAGRPFVWHIYPQAQDAHLAKLNAWLARAPYAGPVKSLIKAWNIGDQDAVSRGLGQALQEEPWSQWRRDTLALREQLAAQAGLVERLLAFCTQKAHSG